jgi:anti-sigma B factor antagonist
MPDKPAEHSLTLDICRKDEMIVVRCHGHLVAGVCDPLYARVHQLMPETKHIVLDLTDLAYMDSMGLGTMVRLLVSAKSAGVKLELVNLGKRVRELLGLTNLLGVFSIIGEQGACVRY